MAKDKKKDHGHAKADKDSGRRAAATDAAVASHAGGATEKAGGKHHAAKAHGRVTTVDMSLPGSRPELMELHAAARARRNAATLDSPAFRAAVMDLERIEIRIAAIDRAADPPLG